MFFCMSNTFISNDKLKLAKNEARAKQHFETDLLLFENYAHFSSYRPKIIGNFLKINQKNKCVCIHEIIGLIKMKMKMKNRSHRYTVNRPAVIHKIFETTKYLRLTLVFM